MITAEKTAPDNIIKALIKKKIHVLKNNKIDTG